MYNVGQSPVPTTNAITGYAGTGKTTLVSQIANNFDPSRILFLAMTGKAVSVLKNKVPPNVGCKTIHSAFFTIQDEQPTPCRYNKTCWHSEFDCFESAPKPIGPPKFIPRDSAINIDQDYDLLIIDEASMLNEYFYKIVNRANVHKIFVGDPGQLPPIDGKQIEILSKTPHKLDKVMRQALDNPIISLATSVREGKNIKEFYKAPHLAIGHNLDPKSALALINYQFMKGKAMNMQSIILCYRNTTRVAINNRVRKNQGYAPGSVHPGEKIVCLRNNWDAGLINGQLYTVQKVEKIRGDGRTFVYLLTLEEDSPNKLIYEVIADPRTFGALNANDIIAENNHDEWITFVNNKHRTNVDQNDKMAYFDYGYALSVHKAQGSEWPQVYLANERGCAMEHQEIRQWMYTGVTRAKDKLFIGLDY